MGTFFTAGVWLVRVGGFVFFIFGFINFQAWLAFAVLLILFTAPLILLPFFPKALNWVRRVLATILGFIVLFSILNIIFMFVYFGKGDAWRYKYKCLQIGTRLDQFFFLLLWIKLLT